MKRAFVIGWPIEHSRSPVMFNRAFRELVPDGEMDILAVRPDELATKIRELRALPMLGACVTVPHKVAVMALCDDVAPEASAIGAVNCLELDRGRLIGHNTDAPGFRDGLDFEPHGMRVVLLGAGGAARAVAYALANAYVEVVARKPVEWIAATTGPVGGVPDTLVARPWSELRAALSRADLLVDCTSAGLDPGTDAALADSLPLDALPQTAIVGTLIYHRRTRLLELAAPRPTFDGRAMLVHQAARAFAIWTHLSPPVDIMSRALASAGFAGTRSNA